MGQQSQDDGYVSQDYHGSHNYSTSGSDLTGYMDTSPSRYTTVQGHMMSPDSSYVKQTPSPSDSGVGEMEAMLQNKNAEIQHLRGVMERNETAIFQVSILYKLDDLFCRAQAKRTNSHSGNSSGERFQ